MACKKTREKWQMGKQRPMVVIILAVCMGMAGPGLEPQCWRYLECLWEPLAPDSVSYSSVDWARSFLGLRLFNSALVQWSRWEIQQICVVLHSCWLIPGKSRTQVGNCPLPVFYTLVLTCSYFFVFAFVSLHVPHR